MPQLRRFQFTLFSLLIAMAVIAVSIVLWKYQAQRRAAVRRAYDEQKVVLEQAVEDFRKELESKGQVWVGKHTGRQHGSGEWIVTAELIAHKRVYEGGESPERLCRLAFEGSVSQDSQGKPNWWSNRPLKITCKGGSEDEKFIVFLAERWRAKKWEFVVEWEGRLTQ